jgi:hypothetical protein
MTSPVVSPIARQGLSYKKDHQVEGQKDMPKAQGHVEPLNMNLSVGSRTAYIDRYTDNSYNKLFNALCISLHLCIPLCDHLIGNVSNK